MNAVMCVPKGAADESISPVFGALLDRPFLQHVIERLVAQGFESLHLVTDRPTPSVNGFVGDGTRWGIHIELHETAGPADCCHLLQRLNPDRPFLLGRADRLVRRDLFSRTRRRIPSHPVSFVEHTRATEGGKPWTGWGWVWPNMLHDLTASCLAELSGQEPPTHGHLVPGRGGHFWRQPDRRAELVTWLRNPPTHGHPEQRQGDHIWRKSDNTVHGQNAGSWPQALVGITDVADALVQHPKMKVQPTDEVLRAYSGGPLLRQPACHQNPRGLLVSGRTFRPGVRIGHGARIHPDVYLTPPVFLGADVEIGPGSVIGPSVVIGAGSIVERNCVIERAVVARGTYVGESLDIRDASVEGEWLHHVRHRTSVHLTDQFLISPLTKSSVAGAEHVDISA